MSRGLGGLAIVYNGGGTGDTLIEQEIVIIRHRNNIQFKVSGDSLEWLIDCWKKEEKKQFSQIINQTPVLKLLAAIPQDTWGLFLNLKTNFVRKFPITNTGVTTTIRVKL